MVAPHTMCVFEALTLRAMVSFDRVAVQGNQGNGISAADADGRCYGQGKRRQHWIPGFESLGGSEPRERCRLLNARQMMSLVASTGRPTFLRRRRRHGGGGRGGGELARGMLSLGVRELGRCLMPQRSRL